MISTGRGPVVTSAAFRDYVQCELGARVAYASAEYPQGSGINESAYRIIETAIKTRTPAENLTMEDIVADATWLYNVCPNRMIKEASASLIFLDRSAYSQDGNLGGACN